MSTRSASLRMAAPDVCAGARLYRRAVGYFRPDLPLVFAWLLLIGCSTGLGLLMAWPAAILVDTVLAPAAMPASRDLMHRLFLAPLPDGRLGRIVGLALVGLGLKLLQELLNVVTSVVCNQINYNGLQRVRCDLFRKLQALNLAYHRTQPQGDAIHRLSSDAFGMQTILQVLVNAGVAVVTLAVMGCVLASRSGVLTLIAFAVLPFLAVANVVFGRRLSRRSMECKELDARFTTAVQRSISSIGLVQAFGREADEFARFRGTIRESIRAWWGLNRQQFTYNVIIGALFGLAGAAIFGYGGYLVYRDQFLAPRPGGMSVGDLMVFTSYLATVWGPLCTITGFAAGAQGGVAGARRVFEILDRDPVIADAPDALPLPRRPREIALDDVSFAYEDERTGRRVQVLSRVSLSIRPGEMVAFVGASGTGKSTLLNLLPRFYDPTGGAVRYDGVDARAVRVKDLRRHVALVLQDSVILPTTVAENIAYSRPHATREQVREAARLAGAAEFIERLPDGYDTPLTEVGQNLSGGQRQRISIARALLSEAPCVVLDEPTSALDPHHEHLITQGLAAIKGSRTVVLVSHRLSTVARCDRIYVMDGGRVVEEGTHDALLARGGVYAAMAARQHLVPDAPRRAA